MSKRKMASTSQCKSRKCPRTISCTRADSARSNQSSRATIPSSKKWLKKKKLIRSMMKNLTTKLATMMIRSDDTLEKMLPNHSSVLSSDSAQIETATTPALGPVDCPADLYLLCVCNQCCDE